MRASRLGERFGPYQKAGVLQQSKISMPDGSCSLGVPLRIGSYDPPPMGSPNPLADLSRSHEKGSSDLCLGHGSSFFRLGSPWVISKLKPRGRLSVEIHFDGCKKDQPPREVFGFTPVGITCSGEKLTWVPLGSPVVSASNSRDLRLGLSTS